MFLSDHEDLACACCGATGQVECWIGPDGVAFFRMPEGWLSSDVAGAPIAVCGTHCMRTSVQRQEATAETGAALTARPDTSPWPGTVKPPPPPLWQALEVLQEHLPITLSLFSPLPWMLP